jgi:hypothetical protein
MGDLSKECDESATFFFLSKSVSNHKILDKHGPHNK